MIQYVVSAHREALTPEVQNMLLTPNKKVPKMNKYLISIAQALSYDLSS